MKRLTKPGITYNFQKLDIAEIRYLEKIQKRLSSYEDTGLEPDVCSNYRKFEDEAISKGVTFKRIVELMNADHDGRLVVLPCGTDVYLERDGYVFKADHWNHTLTAFRDEPKNKSGRQIALFSTKEAEAALKGGEG